MNKKFTFIFVISLLIFSVASINVFAAIEVGGATTCNTASFCSGSYEITCNRVADGYCPEDYGDWSQCEGVVGKKCFPCDPDCLAVGEVCSLVDLYSLGTCMIPGSSISPLVTAYDLGINPSDHTLRLYKGSGTTGQMWEALIPCKSDPCFYKFINVDTLPATGGIRYDYTATTSEHITKPDGVVTKGGYTAPELSGIQVILSDNTIVQDGGTVKGQVKIEAKAESALGIRIVEVFMKKWSDEFAEFRPVYLQDNAGDCSLVCEGSNCNRLGAATYNSVTGNYEINWDTTRCDNKDFEITVIAEDLGIDGLGTDACLNSASIVVTNTEGVSCIDQCPLFGGGIFQSIIAKIKIFIQNE